MAVSLVQSEIEAFGTVLVQDHKYFTCWLEHSSGQKFCGGAKKLVKDGRPDKINIYEKS